MTKKTLILKLHYDASEMNDAQVRDLTAFLLAGMTAEQRAMASFEYLVEDEDTQARHLLQCVRQEFQRADEGHA